jgi:hypothetical protein
MLLQRYYLQPLLTKVTLLLLEGIATNMPLLQPKFTVAIDQFSSSALQLVQGPYPLHPSCGTRLLLHCH